MIQSAAVHLGECSPCRIDKTGKKRRFFCLFVLEESSHKRCHENHAGCKCLHFQNKSNQSLTKVPSVSPAPSLPSSSSCYYCCCCRPVTAVCVVNQVFPDKLSSFCPKIKRALSHTYYEQDKTGF